MEMRAETKAGKVRLCLGNRYGRFPLSLRPGGGGLFQEKKAEQRIERSQVTHPSRTLRRVGCKPLPLYALSAVFPIFA